MLGNVNRNPKEIITWKHREKQYPWSSFRDYIDSNRWGGLLTLPILQDQFKGAKDYEHFVDTSTAKKEYKGLLLNNDILLEAGFEQGPGELIV